MSKKKKDVQYKANVHVSTFELKDSTLWSTTIAETVLREEDPLLAWKGVLSIFVSNLYLKSKTKTFKRIIDFSKIRGLLAPSFHSKVIVLGVLDEKMLYFIVKFESVKDKTEIISRISIIKGPDNSETSATVNTTEYQYDHSEVDRETEPNDDNSSNPRNSDNEIVNNKENGHPIVHKRAAPNSLDYGVINMTTNGTTSNREETEPINYNLNRDEIRRFPKETDMFEHSNRRMSQLDAISDDSDVMPGTWVEDVKYISYEPSLGGNVECDEGSVYMFTAHQIVPNNRYGDSFDSDSD